MPTWMYLAIESKGNFLQGTLEARSLDLAYQQLRRIYPFILSLKEYTGERTMAHSGALRRELHIPSETFAMYIRQLATLISAGIPVPRALIVLSEGENMDMNIVMLRMYKKITAGSSISQAMRENPSVFSAIFTSIVNIGEVSGKLDSMLGRLADLHETNERLRKRLASTMTYPAFLGAATISLLLVFVFYIFPLIQPVFETIGGEMPLLTRMLLFAVSFFQSPWFIVPGAFALTGLVIAFRSRARLFAMNPWLRCAVDERLLKLPLVGQILEKSISSRVLFSLSTMLDSGVPLGEALKSVGDVVSNEVIVRRFAGVWKMVINGSSLHASMGKHQLFPPWVLQMIKVGEESGTVDSMMRRAAVIYQDEVEHLLNTLATALEPVMMCFMGVVVGLVTVATFLPVIQLLNDI